MNRVFYPIKWVLGIVKDIAVSVANRIAIEIFTSYHLFKNDKKWTEIENLTNAIKALEENSENSIHLAKSQYLANLIGELQDFVIVKRVTREELLTALKTHRYWFGSLRKEVKSDDSLRIDISDYIAPPNSGKRKSSQKIDHDNIQPKILSYDE